MLVFNKENGYPMSIAIETMSVDSPKDEWSGYESIVTDIDTDKVIAEFTHETLRGRVHWANGFFDALKYQIKDK